MSQLSAEKDKLNLFLKLIFFNKTSSAEKFFRSKYLINCEAHCHKFKNLNLYISKTVKDIQKILADLSSVRQELLCTQYTLFPLACMHFI